MRDEAELKSLESLNTDLKLIWTLVSVWAWILLDVMIALDVIASDNHDHCLQIIFLFQTSPYLYFSLLAPLQAQKVYVSGIYSSAIIGIDCDER